MSIRFLRGWAWKTASGPKPLHSSVGSMIVGKLGGMSRTAQFGASGLLWTVLAAVAYVTIYGVITAIIGRGC